MARTLNMSASFLNAFLYYLSTTQKAYENFLKSVKKEYDDNMFMQRGNNYEVSVNAGNEGILSEIIVPLKKQGWLPNKFMTISDDYRIKFNGKYDALDEDKGIIYDIKRVDYFLPERYTDEATVQHTLYFYLNPKVTTFYYLIAEGPEDIVKEIHVVEIQRPSEEEIEKRLSSVVKELFGFLVNENLWEIFVSKHEDTFRL